MSIASKQQAGTCCLVDDIERLRAAGLGFRNGITRGPGGHPASTLIELFQPANR
ncbi:hypothetical protein SKC41_28965 [Mycobacterium sp. 050128]|uniref:hypothetical protein n=1 Tax=Mycobacterium sp. 050128 TaxID=3096112 RepID=UPI002ED95D5A